MGTVLSPLALPAPMFWGVLAAWIPIPPAIMVGLLCAVMIYACCQHLLSLREWRTDEPAEEDDQFTEELAECYVN